MIRMPIVQAEHAQENLNNLILMYETFAMARPVPGGADDLISGVGNTTI